MSVVGPAAASFALCLLATLALRPLAVVVDLIDRPGGHKRHIGNIPIIGGLAMLLGIVLGMGLLPLSGPPVNALLAAGAILVTVGLIDDRFNLSPWVRLPAQIASALLIIISTGSVVYSIGSPFGGVEMPLSGAAAYVFTIISIVAGVNAFNMLDGMDGLAGAMALVALTALAALAFAGGLAPIGAIALVVAGAVAAFLLTNIPLPFNRPVRCFMGDSGSTFLGFAVVWLCINVSQGPAPAAKPVTMLWIVAMPLYELVWTIIRRGARGVSPFRSDRSHLHHTLLNADFGILGAFFVFAVLSAALAGIGIMLEEFGVPDSWSFALLIAAGACVIRFFYRAEIVWKFFPRPPPPVRPVDAETRGADS